MPSKLKIAYIIDQLNIGGTENQLLAIIKRLDRTRFEPYLVCLRPTSYFTQCNAQYPKILLNVSSLISFDGLKKLFTFSRFLRKRRVSIVQTFFFDSTVFGIIAAKLAGVKKAISCRRDMGFWYTPKLLLILRAINLMTDRILVNSYAIKDNMVRKEHVSAAKIDVIYNGIDLAPFSVKHDTNRLKTKLGIPASDKVVGIVANLNRPVKRVDLFIEAAAQVLGKERKVSFVIVGEGHLKSSLKQQAADLGILQKTHFVGSQNNVIPYLQLFDVGVLTSDSEGFSNSILEYMAAGLPVVCFDSGGNRELIIDGKNGYLVKNFKTKILADRIILLLYDISKSKVVKKNNLQQVLAYSWDISLKKLSNIYLR